MSDYHKIITAQASQQWEITKGHLRASGSIVGATYGNLPRHMESGETKYEIYSRIVEKFIKDIEDYELQYPPSTH